MPRQAKTMLTCAGIKALNAPGRYADAGAPTLMLFVREGANGAILKTWVQRLTIDGVRREMGLGSWPLVTLAKARAAALGNRRAAHEGRDPAAERRRQRVPTFAEAARQCIAAKKGGWRDGEAIAGVWARTLQAYADPAFGGRPVNAIQQADVLKVLVPLWQSKPSQAKHLRQRVRAVFAWAQAHGHVESNPAGEGIAAALPKQSAARHFDAMPYAELPAALAAVARSGGREAVKACFAFQIATAARPSEAREATWAEIDWESRTWTIPAGRMKTGVEHRVPLNAVAIDALERAKSASKGDLVFPGARGGALAHSAQKRLMVRLGLRGTSHGFRSSFRDWCADTGKPREIAEAALAHVVGGVEGAYFRSDLFSRRRELMDSFARYLTQERGTVVELATAK